MARTRRLTTMIRRFAGDVGGATAIEYALVGAGIGGVIASVIYALGDNVKTTFFQVVSDGLK